MTITDLTQWLTEIWEQQERAYRHPPAFVEDPTSARSPGWGNLGDHCEMCGAYQFSGVESVVEEAWYEHMDRAHDRRFVLARIAADREIVSGPQTGSPDGWDEWAATVRLLATAYADRPGYREEWRP